MEVNEHHSTNITIAVSWKVVGTTARDCDSCVMEVSEDHITNIAIVGSWIITIISKELNSGATEIKSQAVAPISRDGA